MKLAIVYPEVYELARFKEKRKEFPPFGVLYLAAIVEESGIEVQLFKVSHQDTTLNLQAFDTVAFSIPSSATYNIIKEARLKSVFSKNALIMLGGVHPSFFPEQSLLDIQPHVVSIGASEKTIFELLDEKNRRDFSRIKGVCYLDHSQLRKTESRKDLFDLDDLPLPARHLLDESDVVMTNRLSNTDLRITHLMLSRDCPFSCRFCAVFQKRVQYRSGLNVRAELEHLIKVYGINGFAVVDDNFVINKKKVIEICSCIANLGLKWSALSRVDTINHELLESMNEAGCIEIKFGIESGSNRILEAMGKNTTTNQIRNAIDITHSMDIKVKAFVVHGFPGENLDTTRETISLLEDISPMIDRISLFRFVPLPGSYVYKNPKKFGLLSSKKQDAWDDYHIHHNHYHWWGSKKDFEILNKAYGELNAFIKNVWSSD